MKADLTCDRPRDKSNVTRENKQRLGKKKSQRSEQDSAGVSDVTQARPLASAQVQLGGGWPHERVNERKAGRFGALFRKVLKSDFLFATE